MLDAADRHGFTFGGGFILESKTATAGECLRYAMNLPTSVMITGCDSMAILDQAIHRNPLCSEDRRRGTSVARSHARRGGAGQVRTLQDEPVLRPHGEAPSMARARESLTPCAEEYLAVKPRDACETTPDRRAAS